MSTHQQSGEGAAPLVSIHEKEILVGHKGIVIWMTGLSGSGKSTLAYSLEKKLFEEDVLTKVLDGDVLRDGLNAGLGFTDADRTENTRRTAEMAKQLSGCGIVVICSLITPTNDMRRLAEEIIGQENFILYHISTPLEVCEKRDVKGHYKKARTGEILHFTGISDVFEAPDSALFSLDTGELSIVKAVDIMFDDIYPLIIL
jgi:adenylylsulfate kinase